MKSLITLLFTLTTLQYAAAQNLTGQLKGHAAQNITLTGFNYYDAYTLGETTIDSLGVFTINYPKDYTGMAILKTRDNSSLVVLLDGQQLLLKGTHLGEPDSLQFLNNTQNRDFVQIARSNLLNDRAYAGWRYLKKLYETPHFKNQKSVLTDIDNEIQRIEATHKNALQKLQEDSYLNWYAPLRKLVSDMPQSTNNYVERIPEHIAHFRRIDFTNLNFKTSGLIRELIEGHYLMLENTGPSLDSVFAQMNMSTDYLVSNLKQNDSLLNTISEELFTFFEKRSLFKVAAHLSDRLLNTNDCACKLDESLQKKLQKYGALEVGNTAPDIQLSATRKLSDIKQNVLLVFGASWCPHCTEDIKLLEQFYKKWKDNNKLEVVYISLDTSKEAFDKLYKNKPWQTYCDFKGWGTQAAMDYYVNATPTYFLLDKDHKILVHPRSLAHVDALMRIKKF